MKTLLSVMVVATAALALPQDSARLPTSAPATATTVTERGPVPFGVGEKIEYRARMGVLNVGTAAMEVKSITAIRTRPTWNVELRIKGRVSLLIASYSLEGVFSSWMDTTSLYALQYRSDQLENKKPRQRFYEIFPERSLYRLRSTPDTMPEMPSVADPLDEASFLYFIRTIPLVVGETLTLPRYFRPDRNPVVIKVLGKEDVSVPAGIFPAIVIQPTIKTPGLFSQGGEAKVWLADDLTRRVLKITSKTSAVSSLHLEMTKYTPPRPPTRN